MKRYLGKALISLLIAAMLAGCQGTSSTGVDGDTNNSATVTENSEINNDTPTQPPPTVGDSETDNSNPAESKPDQTASQPLLQDEAPTDAFYFAYKERVVELNANAADVYARIGEPNEVFESPSCAFKGVDKKLYYDGFYIDTYPLEGVDYVLSITLSDQTKTPEGIGIGSSFAEVKSVYGEDYEKKLIRYIYHKGDSRLEILIEGDVVTDLTYMNTYAESLATPVLPR